MRIYAEKPWRFTRQVIADVFFFAWSALWIWAAVTVNHLVRQLATPGEKLESAGDGLAGNLAEIQERSRGIPVVGDELSQPFGSAADAANTLADAGRSQQDVINNLATVMSLMLAGLPILLALALWLPLRLAWIRTASAAAKLRHRPGGAELLAMRALSTAPLRRLTRIGDATVAAWRSGDPSAIDALAELELRRLGLYVRR